MAREPLSEPDKKLAQYIAEQFKPVVLVVNKWDKVLENAKKQAAEKGAEFDDELLMQEFGEYLGQELRHLDYAPIMFVTAKDGRNVQKVLDLAQHLFKQANLRVGTGELNRAVKQIFTEQTPSTPRGQRVRVYYATQADVAPPTIVVFVNNPDLVGESYLRFMTNRFRELLPYDEVPIKLAFRGKTKGKPGEELEEIEPERPSVRAMRNAKVRKKPGGQKAIKSRAIARRAKRK